jgi:hypothetical protein
MRQRSSSHNEKTDAVQREIIGLALMKAFAAVSLANRCL